MKLGMIIDPAEYETKLNILVQQFEAKIESCKRPSGWLGRIYKLVEDSSTPIGYKEIAEQMSGRPLNNKDKSDNHFLWRVSSRIGILQREGWLLKVGEVNRIKNKPRMKHSIFIINPGYTSIAAQARVNSFLNKVEKLNQKYLRVSCMTASLVPKLEGMKERHRLICEVRLEGKSLVDIGAKFGITRERVRQIVERNLQPEQSRLKPVARPKSIVNKLVLCDQIRKVTGGYIVIINSQEVIFPTFDAIIEALRNIDLTLTKSLDDQN